jgi:hypothetical protein
MANHSKPKWRFDIIISVCAMLVSVATFGIYLYQTKIIQEQARATVYPHLEVSREYGTGEKPYFFVKVRNVGIGPAFLKTMEFYYKDQIYRSRDKPFMCPTMMFLVNVLPKNIDFPYIANGGVLPLVIPAGEEVKFLVSNDPKKDLELLLTIFEETTMKICYSSVYKEYWTVVNWKQPIECKNCENEDLFKPVKK